MPLADPEVSDTGAEPARGHSKRRLDQKPSLLFALAVAPDFGVDRVLWTMGRIGREYVVRRPVESAVWRVSAHECVVEAPDERTDASHPAMCDIAYRGC